MIRLPVFSGKFSDVNLILFFPSFYSNIINTFHFKLSKDLLKFHLSTKIKDINLFVLLGLGFEIVHFFDAKEYNQIIDVIEKAHSFIKEKDEYFE